MATAAPAAWVSSDAARLGGMASAGGARRGRETEGRGSSYEGMPHLLGTSENANDCLTGAPRLEPRGERGVGRLPEALGGAHVRERRVRLGHAALLGRARAARLSEERGQGEAWGEGWGEGWG